MEKRHREKNTMLLDWFEAILVAVVLMFLVLVFAVRMVNVNGVSMEPTLYDGDQLVVLSLAYQPQQGDIVVVSGENTVGSPIVKRVIGLGGDVVDIDFETGEVSVNGEVLQEEYTSAPTTLAYDIQFPVTVPDGYLFLLGDNRPHSKDSRDSEIGFVDERDLLGKVVWRIFPLDQFGGV